MWDCSEENSIYFDFDAFFCAKNFQIMFVTMKFNDYIKKILQINVHLGNINQNIAKSNVHNAKM